MKTLYTTFVVSVLVLSVVSLLPGVLAVSVGSGITPDITTEKFPPRVWMCDHRIVTDDSVEPGRTSNFGQELIERFHNYAFEGEQISWKVLVMDKNKIDQNIDVYATVGSSQGAGNDIQVNCKRENYGSTSIPNSCNARIQEEKLTKFDENTMAFFTCKLTVETSESMYGEHWVTVEAKDGDGLMGTMDENEFWFFNPVIALSIDGGIAFTDVRPGTDAYSSTLTVGNDADAGSGVMLDMFISGTDFYDSSSSGARCPTTNQLSLSNFRYFATSGAYSTLGDSEIGSRGPGSTDDRDKDAEGYVNIGYASGFNNPYPFYDGYEILQEGGSYVDSVGYRANVLSPGAEMALTFKLSMPEPCVGDFDSGKIEFWGEAV